MSDQASGVLRGGDLFHVGVVVDDPVARMAELTDLFGYEWCEAIGGPVAVSLDGVDTTVELMAWYSKTTPRLEIVHSIADTVWTPAVGSGVHHLGYWVDDVAGASDALQLRGYGVEAVGRRAGGEAYWSYHRSPVGPRVEIVSRQLQPTMDAYFATGRVSA